jgi:hypothetical protein
MAKCHRTSGLHLYEMKDALRIESDDINLAFTDSPISIENFITEF